VSSGLCTVELVGAKLQCRIRSKLTVMETPFTNAVAVGDEVEVSDDGAGGGIVERVLPRRSVLARPDVRSRRSQVIVANAEQLVIVSSWEEPPFWAELVDRCIIAAQRSRLEPVVCVNKIDLAEDAAELEEALEPYEALGHLVVKTSVVSGEGIGDLRDLLRDKTTVLTGMSGTGKSSLISAAQPGLDLRTSHVSSSRKRKGEGRHTTTQVTMLGLEAGGFVVDTPGIREFGLSGLRRHELASFYPEISVLAPSCRFNNCTHIEEPGCAVRSGKDDGAVPSSRYRTYRVIRDTLPE
jgi:ribosome biogenesis GTPase